MFPKPTSNMGARKKKNHASQVYLQEKAALQVFFRIGGLWFDLIHKGHACADIELSSLNRSCKWTTTHGS